MVLSAGAILETSAVLFFSTDDPEHNTTPPSGDLAGSGWDSQGLWGMYLGTAIGPHHFITAKHVGGNVGDPFVLQGRAFNVVETFDDSQSDLRICRVEEPMPLWVRLNRKQDEVSKPVVVFGRGTQRGEPVIIESVAGPLLRGWHWGPSDLRVRWGENRIHRIVNHASHGSLLRCTFDADGGANECHLSAMDSGGGMFLRDGDEWKLAGIHHSVDGPYNLSASGEGFSAAVFDEGGLYKGEPGNWVFVPDLPFQQSGSFYSTRISARIQWIDSILRATASEPALESAPDIIGPFTIVAGAAVDASEQEISIPWTGQSERTFYRLNAATLLRIENVRMTDGQLILRFGAN